MENIKYGVIVQSSVFQKKKKIPHQYLQQLRHPAERFYICSIVMEGSGKGLLMIQFI